MTLHMHVDKESCCGCGACKNACPASAILMIADEDGFLYPQINNDLCINCGLCESVCAYQKETALRMPQAAYAATCLDAEILRRSSSGGIFAVLANSILADGGKVYGAAYHYSEEQETYVAHIGIDSREHLWRLQGSKYAHSDIAQTYQEAEQDLKAGRKVLFSGTPCQIDGLKGYLRKDYENLLTVDIICHGVPSNKHLASYIRYLENKFKGKIVDFQLRDKSKGWEDFFVRAEVQTKQKKITKTEHWYSSAFYMHFLRAAMYRQNCYSCKYAEKRRCSDITLGDYWGIRKEHPELLVEDHWWKRLYKGISCILINTDRGHKMLETVRDEIDCVDTSLDKVSRYNGQLREPATYDGRRDALLARWRQGYAYVQNDFRATMGMAYYKRRIIDLIRPEWKYTLKRLIRELRKK